MKYFALLTASTIVIAVLALALYRKRRDVGVLVGTAALYYWSLFGAWYIVIDKLGGFSGKNYHYLERKMFPVQLDGNYMLTLVLYSSFIILAQLTLLLTMSCRRERPIPRLVLRHEAILIASYTAGLASFLIIRGKLSTAWALDTSAYLYTRAYTGEWFTLHQVLNRAAMIPAALGLAALLAGDRSRFFVNVRRRYTLPAYLLFVLGMGAFTFVLGNKNEVLVSLIAGVLAYLASVRRPNLLKVGLVLLAGMWFLDTIDFFRGVPVSEMRSAVEQRLENATSVARFVTSSNEAYAAHFSMYGVLADRVEPRFGYSFYALACSIVPRVLWPDRPRDIYLYYSQQVGTIQNQGYSIHQATGWYLNFGIAGVALGAIVLGLIWAYCLNAHQRIRAKSGLLFRIFAVIAPWLFVAYLPPLIRAGPEGYKGLIVEGFLIPVGTLAMACRAKKTKRRRIAAPAPETEAAWLLPQA
ncbi:MAG TPA: hypothetical protein VFW83_07420 [Bryobacteraceae bacterium]|nr:hypothetical protein [Bryobacteraceae bacterium]